MKTCLHPVLSRAWKWGWRWAREGSGYETKLSMIEEWLHRGQMYLESNLDSPTHDTQGRDLNHSKNTKLTFHFSPKVSEEVIIHCGRGHTHQCLISGSYLARLAKWSSGFRQGWWEGCKAIALTLVQTSFNNSFAKWFCWPVSLIQLSKTK